MKKYIEIVKIKQIGDFSLALTFNDKETKKINFKTYFEKWRGVFEPLKDKNEFKKYRIDMAGGLVWDCGADLGADRLYESEGKVNNTEK